MVPMPSPASPPSFYKSFIHLVVPVATQNLFFNLIGIFDVLMVGQLGDVSVAAVGLAGQFFFLLNLTLFGITGGAAVFVAQYWGAHDLPNLRRVLGLCLAVCTSVGAGFAAVALTFPVWVMGLYTRDAAVIALGSAYLRIIGWSYVCTAVTFAFASTLRSSGNTRLPMLVSVTMLSVNTLLNYGLIFGKFGLPALGVRGSAVGTALCRGLECAILLTWLYGRRLPIAATLRQLFDLDLAFASHHLSLILIVFVNEFVWALGVNVYNAVMARLGTSAYAGYSIASTLQSLGIFFAMGCATTCAIMVGHSIGAGELEAAYRAARRILIISVTGSFFIGLILAAVRQPLLELYRVSPEARADASAMLLVAGLMLWLRSLDPMLIIGILRSGGDTRHAALLDVGGIWLAGIPAVILAAFVFRLPVQWVFLAIMAENLVKNSLAFRRFFSRRWIRKLAMPA
jgi:putative MATE family efflux protein